MTAIAATTSAIPPISGSPPPPWEDLTREPRRYGFHATLKAPFRLLPPFTEADLVAELDRFSALPRASVSVEPTIRAIERFIAIVPRGASAAVEQLAADCVTVFDRFRRPLTPQERNRRVARGRGRSPDRKPRPLGLPVRVRGLSLSHDADRRDRYEPPWPDHRASAGCLRASRGKPSIPITQLVLARQDAPAARFRVVREAKLAASQACE